MVMLKRYVRYIATERALRKRTTDVTVMIASQKTIDAPRDGVPPDPAPYYFNVVVWGKSHCDYLMNYCIRSLLSPNNIPILNDKKQRNKFLFATPVEDWARIKCNPIFSRLAQYVEPVLIELPPHNSDVSNCIHMNIGHKAISEILYSDRAAGVMLTPDLLVSDGTLAHIQTLVQNGKQVVYLPAYRFLTNLLLPQIDETSANDGEFHLTVSGRQLVKICLSSLHPESRHGEWRSNYFADFPTLVYWRIPDNKGLLMHGFSWAPFYLNYSTVAEHDTSTLENWTIDGSYVCDNFFKGNIENIETVCDSDQGMLASWATEDECRVELIPSRYKANTTFGTWFKGSLLSDAYWSNVYDPLKRELFFRPIRWHIDDLSCDSSNWKTYGKYAQFIFFDFINPRERAGLLSADQVQRITNLPDTPRRRTVQASRIRRQIIVTLYYKVFINPVRFLSVIFLPGKPLNPRHLLFNSMELIWHALPPPAQLWATIARRRFSKMVWGDEELFFDSHYPGHNFKLRKNTDSPEDSSSSSPNQQS